MLLIDTDMLVLLAASGLLDRVVDQLGFKFEDMRCLAAATHQIRRSRSLRNQYGSEVLAALMPKVETIAVVEPATDLELLNRLNALMDPGEALLVAIAVSRSESLFVTGDKQAIRKLASCGDSHCIQALQGRIVTLEVVLRNLTNTLDTRALRDAFQVALNHKTLRVIFSDVNLNSDAGCETAISSYLSNVRLLSGGMLYDP